MHMTLSRYCYTRFPPRHTNKMFSKVSINLGGKLKKLLTQRSSSSMQALLDQSAKARQLPREISLQVLDERHNLNQIRNLLARAFVVNNEPIVNVLGEIYYPAIPSKARFPLIEERFKHLFSDKSIAAKVDQGLSFVAVKDKDPMKLVSVMCAEKYTGEIYKGETSSDPLCQAGVNLMRAVHEVAKPVLEEHASTRDIIFVSHTATAPEYRSLGIVENLGDTLRSRVIEERPAVCVMLTSHKLAGFTIQRYGFHVIAEVLYKDYSENGRKVFEQLSEQEVSAKALFLCL